MRLDLAGRGYGVDAAAYWQVRADTGIGLVYRGQTTIGFAGPANFTAPDAFSEKTPDQTARTELTMPDQIVVGARWQRGRFAALLDVAYDRWRVNQRTVVTFANASTPQAIQANGWHDTATLRVGGESRHGRLDLRAGGYVDPSPVPAEHLTPASPDATRLGMTVGASWRLGRAWTADVFAERMWLLRRETTSTDTMPASYGGTALVFGASVRWSPGPEQ